MLQTSRNLLLDSENVNAEVSMTFKNNALDAIALAMDFDDHLPGCGARNCLDPCVACHAAAGESCKENCVVEGKIEKCNCVGKEHK